MLKYSTIQKIKLHIRKKILNTLFYIGENYTFKPLQNYAIRYAQNLFGKIHCIYFLDSIDSPDTNKIDFTNQPDSTASNKADFSKILKHSLQTSQNLLILAYNSTFNGILNYFEKNFLLTPTLEKGSYTFKLQDCTILLQSPTTIPQKMIPQNSFNHTFLYPLGLDYQSALALLSPLANTHQIQLQITNKTHGIEILEAKANSKNTLESFLQEIRQTFQNKIFPSTNLAQSIIQLLADSKQKITTAESCTGGLLAYYLTQESGASEVFDGGIISYANALKESWLKVSRDNLDSFGAVSEAVVREMLQGALNLSGADFAIATSGVAGPGGGSASKPVGTIFIGVKSKKGEEIIKRVLFSGDRNYIQEQSCWYAYLMFLKLFFKLDF